MLTLRWNWTPERLYQSPVKPHTMDFGRKGKHLLYRSPKLKTYSGEQLSVKGVIKVEVQYKDQCEQLQLVVARGNGPSLFGRDWLMKLRLDWTQLCANHVCYSLSLQDILDEHSSVFSSEFGTLKDTTVSISLDPDSTATFLQGQNSALFNKREN